MLIDNNNTTVVDTNLTKCVVFIDIETPHINPQKNTFPLNFPHVDWVPFEGGVDFVGDVG